MARRPGLHLSQRAAQEMLQLPRMLQSIEILKLPVAELCGYLERMGEENEALEVVPNVRRADRRATDDHDAMLQNQPAPEKGLAERVEEQLALSDLEPELCEWVRFLVSCLDARGYLSASDEFLLELAHERGLEGGAELLGPAISALQGLEPRGLGGRNAIESLLLQLDPSDPFYPHLCRLLEDFLEDLAKNRTKQVARALGLSLEQLSNLLETIRLLDPRPAAALVHESAPIVRPEVRVDRGPDGFEITVDQSGLPGVSLDEGVARLARDREQPAEVREYLRKKVQQARWIAEAVGQRKATLERIATLLFHAQTAFLEDGPGHLVPLGMNDLAEDLGLAVSTVSRAVAGKHAQTPWGVYPLRFFFQAAAGGEGGKARDDVREVVRRVFEGEDPAAPLSDDEVVGVLGRRGIEVARRTVAKYRGELGIPSSYVRRRN